MSGSLRPELLPILAIIRQVVNPPRLLKSFGQEVDANFVSWKLPLVVNTLIEMLVGA